MREPRHIAPREGRLLMRDRVQPKGRIGDDPRAITTRDLPVHLGAIGLVAFTLDAPILNTSGGRSDLALRLQCDALRFETPMVDARVDVEFGQPLIVSAQRSRQRATISVRFQSRTLGPKPSSSTARRSEEHT